MSVSLPDEEHQRRMELYREGLTDGEIADIVGVKTCTIWEWRNKTGLNPNVNVGGLSKKDIDRRKKLIKKGLSDREVAERIGIETSALQKWRNENRIEPNFSRGGQAIKLDFIETWELGYFVGVICGDGSLNRSGTGYITRVVSTNREFISILFSLSNNLFPELSPNVCSFDVTNTLPDGTKIQARCHALSISSKCLYEYLKRYKKKNYIWISPDSKSSEAFKFGFLGGIIDTDGSISRSCISIVSKHQENLLRLKSLIREIGLIYGKINIFDRERDYKQFQLNIYGRENHWRILERSILPLKRNTLSSYLEKDSRDRRANEYITAMKLSKEGKSPTKISEIIGVHERTIESWLYQNIKPRCIKLAEKYG